MSRRESAESIELSVEPIDAFTFASPQRCAAKFFENWVFPGYGVRARWNPLRNQLNVQESGSG